MVTAIEHDAIAAYLAMIERLESLAHKAKVTESRGNHKHHLRELQDMGSAEGGMKQILTTGKVRLADLMSADIALLKKMGSNKNDTQAYEQTSDNSGVPAEHRLIFQHERRQRAYMKSATQQAA